ncbi:MAG: tungsten formylmethanofuran dehydrogenase [Planctomycetes bacterium]|nr:tungsten formylmethanofuran dehydrogenase [Planctomycetota bacterium]MCL4730263.1 tungsten formylmethanofuran dehydrogenase [Planctomycetota bacterium]
MPRTARSKDTKGLSPEQILGAYRTMVTSRKTEDKCSIILRQSKGGSFQISGPGHEAALVAASMVLRPGRDWSICHYRDLTYVLGLGMTTEEIFTGFMAREGDPNSGSRQMPSHFGHKKLRIINKSSCVGTQWLQAGGRAYGIKLDGEDEVVYVSSGDATCAQGEFHEGLNWATIHKLPVLFHVEDNNYGISTHSSQERAQPIEQMVKGYANLGIFAPDGCSLFDSYEAFKQAHEWCRSGKGPAIVVSKVVRLWGHSSSDNRKLYMTDAQIAEESKRDPITILRKWIIENGVAEEDELVALEEQIKADIDASAERAEQAPHPDPSQAARNVFYEGPDNTILGTAAAPAATGDPVTLIDAINHALHEEFERDPHLVCWGQDVQDGKGGVFGATKGLSTKFGARRVFNSPLAEATIVGTGLGYSYKPGRKAVVEIQFGDYIFPAMMQIVNEVATARYRSDNNWPAPMVIRVPVGGYIQGAMYHSQCIEGLFASRPGLRIAMPSNAADAKGLLKAAIRGQDPVLFMECKNLYRQERSKSPEPDKDYLLPFGKGRIVRQGKHVTLVTWGNTVNIAIDAAGTLEDKGIEVEIIDLRTILPWDSQLVFESIKKTSRCLVLHEDTITMGFGAEISARIMEDAFELLDAPVRRVAARDSFVPYAKPLENAVLPQKADVIAGVEALVTW